MIPENRLDRRGILKVAAGAGSVAALSPLGQTSKAANGLTRIGKSPKKLVIIASELGYYDPFFRPRGDDPVRSPLLSELRHFDYELTVFRNIAQPEIGHGHYNSRGILTCRNLQSAGPKVSLDQLAAAGIEQNARYKHINLGRPGLSWNVHSREAVSERDIGPENVFAKLFTKSGDEAELQRKVDSLELMRKTMPANPQSAYLRAVRELEEQVRIDLEWNQKPVPDVEVDTRLHLSDAHGRGVINPLEQQLQMVRLAIQHQRVQVALVSPPYVDRTSTIGVDGTYHRLGHWASSKVDGMEQELLKLETYLFREYAKFLASLKEHDLLEDTIVLIVGSFQDAGRHRRDYLPTVLVGGGFNHRGLVDCVENGLLKIRQSHLYLSVLRQMGIHADQFASDSGNVDDLLL